MDRYTYIYVFFFVLFLIGRKKTRTCFSLREKSEGKEKARRVANFFRGIRILIKYECDRKRKPHTTVEVVVVVGAFQKV